MAGYNDYGRSYQSEPHVVVQIDQDARNRTASQNETRMRQLAEWKQNIVNGIDKATNALDAFDRRLIIFGQNVFGQDEMRASMIADLKKIRTDINAVATTFKTYPKPTTEPMVKYIQQTFAQYQAPTQNLLTRNQSLIVKFEKPYVPSTTAFRKNTIFDDEESNAGSRTGSPDLLLGHQQMQQNSDRAYVESEFHRISSRDKEIQGLLESVVELNQLFIDLQVLVQEQEPMIETIHQNVEDAVDNTGVAVQQIGQAQEYQRSSRKKQCCLLLICLVILGVITAVLVVQFPPNHNGGGGSGNATITATY